jgi:hypothetical protein
MNAMKNILIVMTMLVLPLVSSKAQFKTSENKQAFEHHVATEQFEFQSTSTMAGSGSTLPIAARNGLTIGANSPDDYSSSGGAHGPRRIGGSGSGTGGNEAEESHDPQETPVGDGVWVMMLLAVGYAWYRKWREWRKISCLQS